MNKNQPFPNKEETAETVSEIKGKPAL